MKKSAMILNVLMLFAILVICIKNGVRDTTLVLIIAGIVSFNFINILALNKNTTKSINSDEEKLSKKSKLKIGVILIFIGLFLPSATYPLTTVDDDIHDIQIYSAMKGREYSPSFRELNLEYSTHDYIKYKNVLFLSVLCVFSGSALIVREVLISVSKSKENP